MTIDESVSNFQPGHRPEVSGPSSGAGQDRPGQVEKGSVVRLSIQRAGRPGERGRHLATGLPITDDLVLVKPPAPRELLRPGPPDEAWQVVIGLDPLAAGVRRAAVAEVHLSGDAADPDPFVVLALEPAGGTTDHARCTSTPPPGDPEPPADETIALRLGLIQEPSEAWLTAVVAAPTAAVPCGPGHPDDIIKWICKRYPRLHVCTNH